MKLFILLICSLPILCGCLSNNQGSYMAFDDVVYIDKFPESIYLTDGEIVDLDIIGIKDIAILDTFLIISSRSRSGLWSIYSIKDSLQLLGDFLKTGNGPNEFSYPPNLYNTIFHTKENQLFAKVADSRKGKIYEMNITESVNKKDLAISSIDDTLRSSMFVIVPLCNNESIYYREINDNLTQQNRYIKSSGGKSEPIHFQRLNQAAIEKGEDHNILSALSGRKSDQDIIIEAALFLNQINIFSVDGLLQKTLCVGSKLNSIEDIQNTFEWNRIYTYTGVRTYNKIWGALYEGETKINYERSRKNLPAIQLFDWNGEPLAELKLDRNITTFAIDFHNGYLYTFDSITDQFYFYDIKKHIKPEWI